MLVMRRRAGESILLGEEIEVQVIEVGPRRVKLGIVAPKNLAIVRKEVRITAEENLAAADGTNPVAISALLRHFRQSADTTTVEFPTPESEGL